MIEGIQIVRSCCRSERAGNMDIVRMVWQGIWLSLPFTWLLGMLLRNRWRMRPWAFVLGRLTISGFLMSLFIETVQVVWNWGTLQFSDLFYNTLGGMIGGLLFVGGRWLKSKNGGVQNRAGF